MLSWKFFKTSNTISTAVSLGEFVHQLLLKVISLQEKSTGRLIFWRNKESKFLLDTLQSKKMNNKHSQVLLVFRKNPRKWSYGWSSVLKTSIRTYCRYFRTILLFWWSIFDGTNIHRKVIYRKTFVLKFFA